jgi:hypothetical protein
MKFDAPIAAVVADGASNPGEGIGGVFYRVDGAIRMGLR